MSKSVNSDLPDREIGKASSPSDSFLGSLLAETFVGSVFAPLLPLWAQGVDWSNVADAADTVWMDRRNAPLPAPVRAPAPFGIF